MSTAVVDFRTSNDELSSLRKLGFDVLLCPHCDKLYTAVSGHPDMQMTTIDANTLIVNKDIQNDFIKSLSNLNKEIHKSYNSINENYPRDIILNSLILGDIFIHRLDCTDPNLLNLIKSKKLINVKQGYTKCSTAIVNDKAIITSDKSIINALKNEDIDILYVPPGDIELPGLNYGFIGGTCGLIDEKHLAFFGDLNFYEHGKEIISFLKNYDVTPVYLRKDKLIDRGSLFII